mmetsp:Transcript_20759/g.24005  ORF Transcript_20759/g.24005 Transcript_20759/m.24005 type:complete len:109 (-) Transcript_20759:486-812(-)
MSSIRLNYQRMGLNPPKTGILPNTHSNFYSKRPSRNSSTKVVSLTKTKTIIPGALLPLSNELEKYAVINKDLSQVKDYNENKDHIQEESIGLTESDLSEILDKDSSLS